MRDCLVGCAGALRPIYEAMCDRARLSKVIHTDVTPVAVLGRSRDRTRTGRIRVHVGDAANPYTVYDATPIPSRDSRRVS